MGDLHRRLPLPHRPGQRDHESAPALADDDEGGVVHALLGPLCVRILRLGLLLVRRKPGVHVDERLHARVDALVRQPLRLPPDLLGVRHPGPPQAQAALPGRPGSRRLQAGVHLRGRVPHAHHVLLPLHLRRLPHLLRREDHGRGRGRRGPLAAPARAVAPAPGALRQRLRRAWVLPRARAAGRARRAAAARGHAGAGSPPGGERGGRADSGPLRLRGLRGHLPERRAAHAAARHDAGARRDMPRGQRRALRGGLRERHRGAGERPLPRLHLRGLRDAGPSRHVLRHRCPRAALLPSEVRRRRGPGLHRRQARRRAPLPHPAGRRLRRAGDGRGLLDACLRRPGCAVAGERAGGRRGREAGGPEGGAARSVGAAAAHRAPEASEARRFVSGARDGSR
mmetsp:Transcript_141453/g.439674  ORF Transcript_141453/g.439674 Transcript_141453/m.439674 type:complete len:397 (-) Transcript_141453:195-1385(-)